MNRFFPLLLAGLFLMIGVAETAQAQSSRELQWRQRPIKLFFHVESLTGAGAGLRWRIKAPVELEAKVGIPMFTNAGQPFADNRVSAVVAARVHVRPSIFATVGGYIGYYKFEAQDKYGARLVREQKKQWIPALRLSAGGQYTLENGRTIGVEVAASFFLPDLITEPIPRGTRIWIFEAPRSMSGALFPSIGLFYQF